MIGLPIQLSAVSVFLIAAILGAQDKVPSWMGGILPPDAKIIETAELNLGSRNARGLVLWMIQPKRVMRQGDRSCSDWVYGDHWYGPTRVSLVDYAEKRLINTIEVRGLYEGSAEAEHGFPIPFHVSNDFYHVSQIDKHKEGAPRVLDLRNLTGEAVAGQFVLYEYEVCGTALTTVLGYSSSTDSAVQYQVEIAEPGERTEVVLWVPHLFSEKPIRRGHWNFTWEPGHGADCWIHEQVTFDAGRQLFVDQRKVTPYPNLPVRNAHPKSKK